MTRLLFLDDDENRALDMKRKCDNSGYDMTWARNHDEAVRHLNGERFDIVSLDHDLGELKNGRDVVKHLISLPKEKHPNLAIVHSHNRIGGITMFHWLKNAGIQATHQPYMIGQ